MRSLAELIIVLYSAKISDFIENRHQARVAMQQEQQ